MSVLFTIDPGKTGAIAIFRGGVLSSVLDPGAQGLAPLLAALLLDEPGATVVIEQVNGVPGQSGPASFDFGKSYGELLGVCIGCGIAPRLVRPVVWKGELGLHRRTMSVAEFKAQSRQLAATLFPAYARHFARAKDDGRAEACLIGHYALKKGLL